MRCAARRSSTSLLAEGLLEAPDELQADYRLTERFLEFAAARVVEPLPRERARQLLLQACALAARSQRGVEQQPARSRGACAFRQLHDPRHAARRAVHRHRGAAARGAAAGALGPDEGQERGGAENGSNSASCPRSSRPHGQRDAAAAAPVRRRLPRRFAGPAAGL